MTDTDTNVVDENDLDPNDFLDDEVDEDEDDDDDEEYDEVTSEDENDDDDFSTTGATSVGKFNIEFSDVPKINRPAPPGRTAFAWERALAPIRENRGHSARILRFDPDEKSDPKSRAQAKSQQIRNRLYEKVPDEHWDIKSRALRDSDGNETESWGVWVIYHGKLSPEQQAKRDAKRAERAARILKGRAKKAEAKEAASA